MDREKLRDIFRKYRAVGLVLLAGLTVKVGRMLRVKNRFWYFLIGFSCALPSRSCACRRCWASRTGSG